MGISVDAILFYGYAWKVNTEEIEYFESWPEDGEWPEIVLINRGEENPWDRYEDLTVPNNPDAVNAAYEPRVFTENGRMLVDAWYRAKQDVEEEYGVEFFTHGSSNYEVPAVAIKSSLIRVSYGELFKIDPDFIDSEVDWDDKLNRWIIDLGITLDPDEEGVEWAGPAWFLVAYTDR